ncbi:MAG: VWA domain-containing protein [Eggerthellaceae bacterium]|nr:VWA domain-containing protein [Eggerthellaceae bacterium]
MHFAKRLVGVALMALLAFGTVVGAAGCRANGVKAPASDKNEPTDGGYYYTSPSEAPTSCVESYEGALPDGGYYIIIDEPGAPLPWNTEEYAVITEHGFISVLSKPFSTFGADVDTASYCNLRRMIRQGLNIGQIPAGAVRIEEMLNYFTYSYAGPQAGSGDLFGVTAVIGDCPWNPDTKLLVIGLTAKEADVQASAGNNLVFLIDVSGSMRADDKLPLLKESFRCLLEELDPNDTVSIVTYASGEEVVLEGAKASERERILAAIDSLTASGSTNGHAGLAMAYEVAARHFIEGGNNRIILASDGDLNVGITSQSDLEAFVAKKRDGGVYLSVLGFGDGNYKDTKMETIADAGNGAYYYIDCIEEAQRIFGEQLTRTMYAVANDVKFQLEFNPAYVKGYRQVGYENRELTDDQFKDDKVDAGEVGSGAQIIVAYELVMTDSDMQLFTSDSRYGAGSAGVENGEWFALAVRWKEPGSTAASPAQERSYTFGAENYVADPSTAANLGDAGKDWAFASQVIRFGMLVADSDNLGTATLDALQQEVMASKWTDERRAEFTKLVCRILAQ